MTAIALAELYGAGKRADDPPAPPACIGIDPILFDARTIAASAPALAYCAACTVIAWCDDWVRPGTSYYDGVAAGNVWANGRLIGGNP